VRVAIEWVHGRSVARWGQAPFRGSGKSRSFSSRRSHEMVPDPDFSDAAASQQVLTAPVIEQEQEHRPKPEKPSSCQNRCERIRRTVVADGSGGSDGLTSRMRAGSMAATRQYGDACSGKASDSAFVPSDRELTVGQLASGCRL